MRTVPVEDEADQHEGGHGGRGRGGAVPGEDIRGHIPGVTALRSSEANQRPSYHELTSQRTLRLCPHMERMPSAVIGEDRASSQPRLWTEAISPT